MFDLSILFAALARPDVAESGSSSRVGAHEWQDALKRALANAFGAPATPVAEGTTRSSANALVPLPGEPSLQTEAAPVVPAGTDATVPAVPTQSSSDALLLTEIRVQASLSVEVELAAATFADASLATGNAPAWTGGPTPTLPEIAPVTGGDLQEPLVTAPADPSRSAPPSDGAATETRPTPEAPSPSPPSDSPTQVDVEARPAAPTQVDAAPRPAPQGQGDTRVAAPPTQVDVEARPAAPTQVDAAPRPAPQAQVDAAQRVTAPSTQVDAPPPTPTQVEGTAPAAPGAAGGPVVEPARPGVVEPAGVSPGEGSDATAGSRPLAASGDDPAPDAAEALPRANPEPAGSARPEAAPPRTDGGSPRPSGDAAIEPPRGDAPVERARPETVPTHAPRSSSEAGVSRVGAGRASSSRGEAVASTTGPAARPSGDDPAASRSVDSRTGNRPAASTSASDETSANQGNPDGDSPGRDATRDAHDRAAGADRPRPGIGVARPMDRPHTDAHVARATSAPPTEPTGSMVYPYGATSGPMSGEPGASLVARVPHQQLAEAIVSRARALPADGSLEIRFALEPEDLGPVRVQIISRGEQVEIRILASSGAAVDALGAGVSRLTTQLVEAGFRDPAIQLALDDSGSGGQHGAHDTGDRPHGGRASTRDDPALDSRAGSDDSEPRAGRLDRTA